MEKTCRLLDLGCKEVINLSDGARLGFTRDVELDTESGQITALIIPGRLRCFGLLGREADTVVPWSAIERLGVSSNRRCAQGRDSFSSGKANFIGIIYLWR